MITRSRRPLVGRLVLFAVLGGSVLSPGAFQAYPQGSWPSTWPKELEPYRDRAETQQWSTATVYAIPFWDRAEFERIWPVILTLKEKNGSLALRTGDVPCVRISTPREPHKITFRGNHVQHVPPWPESAHNPDGSLPEYVEWSLDEERWRPAPKEARLPMLYKVHRAQIGIELVVDGDVIDLNRIHLPDDTRISDGRKLAGDQPAAASQPASAGSEPAGTSFADDAMPVTLLYDVVDLVLFPGRKPSDASIDGAVSALMGMGDDLHEDSERSAKDRERLKTAMVKFHQSRHDSKRPAADLKELIASAVQPDTWESVGGAGRIHIWGSRIIIRQTREVHEQVRQFLDILRSLSFKEDPAKR